MNLHTVLHSDFTINLNIFKLQGNWADLQFQMLPPLPTSQFPLLSASGIGEQSWYIIICYNWQGDLDRLLVTKTCS